MNHTKNAYDHRPRLEVVSLRKKVLLLLAKTADLNCIRGEKSIRFGKKTQRVLIVEIKECHPAIILNWFSVHNSSFITAWASRAANGRHLLNYK